MFRRIRNLFARSSRIAKLEEELESQTSRADGWRDDFIEEANRSINLRKSLESSRIEMLDANRDIDALQAKLKEARALLVELEHGFEPITHRHERLLERVHRFLGQAKEVS